MTEAEWLACDDPTPMLDNLSDRASERKLRLFAVACCRRVWHLLNEEPGRHAVEIGEQFADGSLTVSESLAIGQELNVFNNNDLVDRLSQETGVYWEAISLAFHAAGLTTGWLDANQTGNVARVVASAVGCQAVADDFGGDYEAYEIAALPFERIERATQASLLRDIFCAPFRPVTIDPAWLTWNGGAIPKLAHTIYDDRAFDRMHEMANALTEAGCTNEDLLAHSRSGSEHVRGCWVVDLLLRKE
jgi:hypothetical protein